MEEVQAIDSRVITSGLKGNHWTSCTRRVDKVKRGAEQAGQRLSQGNPLCECSGQNLISIIQYLQRFAPKSVLLVICGVNPRPKLNTSAAFLAAIPWPRAPAFGVPSPSGKAEVKLFRMSVLEYLA